MKIIADAQIPAIKEYFGGNAELILKNGRDLQAADLTDAEVLIVRSVTRVDQDLLQNSQIKFVGYPVVVASRHYLVYRTRL
jgi:erythronate-4-phosphate dehydrogenase